MRFLKINGIIMIQVNNKQMNMFVKTVTFMLIFLMLTPFQITLAKEIDQKKSLNGSYVRHKEFANSFGTSVTGFNTAEQDQNEAAKLLLSQFSMKHTDEDKNRRILDAKIDTNGNNLDTLGNGCTDYGYWDLPTAECGQYDTADFQANEMCVNCGGGTGAGLIDGFNDCIDTDQQITDYHNYGCQVYSIRPGWCGTQNTEEFDSMTLCCSCGGGQTVVKDESTHWIENIHSPCEDTDNGALDSYGDACSTYNENVQWCGNYDDDDFASTSMCCACRGGTTQSSMLCRPSDYRTVASDPDYDAIAVQADIGERGYHMLLMVTAQRKSSSELTTIIYVLGGWECQVRFNYQIPSSMPFISASIAKEWKYFYYDTNRQLAFEWKLALFILTQSSDGQTVILTGKIGTGTTFTQKFDMTGVIPTSFQTDDLTVYFATSVQLYKFDFTADQGQQWIRMPLDNNIQVLAAGNTVVLVDYISGALIVKITESTFEYMNLEMSLAHQYGEPGLCWDTNGDATDSFGDGCVDYDGYPEYCGGYDDDDFISSDMCCECMGKDKVEPVVRIGMKENEAGVADGIVMCSHLPDLVSQRVLFDSISLDGQVSSLQMSEWAQCLAAIGPTNEHPWSLFMLMQPDKSIKMIQIQFEVSQVNSKTSEEAVPNLLSFNGLSSSAYGILFHEEAFVFGITNYVYEQHLPGDAGFLMSLENFRSTEFFAGDYQVDATITVNSQLDATLIVDGLYQDSLQETDFSNILNLESDLSKFSFDRHKFHEDLCQKQQELILFSCYYFTSSGEQTCDDPISLSKFNVDYSDVCYPLWLQGTPTESVQVFIVDGDIKPDPSQVKLGMYGSWWSISFNDSLEKNTEYFEIRMYNDVVNQFEVEPGRDYSFSILDHLNDAESEALGLQINSDEIDWSLTAFDDDSCERYSLYGRQFFTFDEITNQLEIKGSSTFDFNCTAVYEVTISFRSSLLQRDYNVINEITFGVREPGDLVININRPWAEFYFYNEANSKLKMDPPSVDQILNSNLSHNEQIVLMAKLYSEALQQPQAVNQSSSDMHQLGLILTEQQLEKAILEAESRRDQFYLLQSQVISIQFDLDSSGLLTIQFDRSTFLPSYMIDLINNSNMSQQNQTQVEGNSRNLQGSEYDYGIKFEQFANYAEIIDQALAEASTSFYTANEELVNQILQEFTEERSYVINSNANENVETQDCEHGQYFDRLIDQCKSYENQEEEAEIVDVYLGHLDEYIDISVENQSGENYQVEWDFVDASNSSIQIRLDKSSFSLKREDTLVVKMTNFTQLDSGFPSMQLMKIDLLLLHPVEKASKPEQIATTAATAVLLVTSVAQLMSQGSLSMIWGTINAMQIAAYMPIINMSIPGNAGAFSKAIAGIVTFDIPGVDMESVFGDIVKCPDDDDILTDLDDESLSDQTSIKGTPWSELRQKILNDPEFDLVTFAESFDENERNTLTKLQTAQELLGWEHPLEETEGKAFHFKAGLQLLGFESAYLSRDLGTVFLWILLMTFGLITILFLMPCTRIRIVKKAVSKLKEKLLWNAMLRTVMQTSLEFGFCCVLTLKYAKFDGSLGATINFAFAYLFTVLLCLFPIFCAIFYQKHFNIFREIDLIQEDEGDAHNSVFMRSKSIDMESLWQRHFNYFNQNQRLETLCKEFYQSKDMQIIAELISKAEQANVSEVIIQWPAKSQIKMLALLQQLNYIEDGVIISNTADPYVALALNGRFSKYYEKDMQREQSRSEFMKKYGDPLSGLNLRKHIVVWFPTYFTVRRLMFVLVTLVLWESPQLTILVRLMTAFAAFITLTVVQPNERRLDAIMELVNEGTTVFIVDCFILLAYIMDHAEKDEDSSYFTTSEIEVVRGYSEQLYIGLFASNVVLHLVILMIVQLKSFKLQIQRKWLIAKHKYEQEKSFQMKISQSTDLHGVKRRWFVTGLCMRMCYKNKTLQQDQRLGLNEEEFEIKKITNFEILARINEDTNQKQSTTIRESQFVSHLQNDSRIKLVDISKNSDEVPFGSKSSSSSSKSNADSIDQEPLESSMLKLQKMENQDIQRNNSLAEMFFEKGLVTYRKMEMAGSDHISPIDTQIEEQKKESQNKLLGS